MSETSVTLADCLRPKDYAVQVKVKNNWLLTRMRLAGFDTVSALSRACGIQKAAIGEYLNLKKPPILEKGQWSATALRLSEFLRCLPEDLFPPQHHRKALRVNTGEVQVSAREIPEIVGSSPNVRRLVFAAVSPEEEFDRKQMKEVVHEALCGLSAMQEQVLRLRFGIGCDALALEQVAEQLGVSKERVRQKEGQALRLLKHPSHARRTKDWAGELERKTMVVTT